MPGSWKTVRVFISSTFRDMHAERDHLVKVVFPTLRERLEKHRVYLIDIDLRWGVTREQAENEQVIDLCLQQAQACEVFVGILGQRYGWVPASHPPDLLHNHPWVAGHRDRSVTELEILHGVLNGGPNRKPALFYFRDPATSDSIPQPIRTEVFVETDAENTARLENLKEQIRATRLPLLDAYPAHWAPQAYDRPSKTHGRLTGLEAFGECVRDQLWLAIQEKYRLPEQSPVETAADPLAEEQDYHERFLESRLRVYVGREQINDALLAFTDGNDRVPCLVTGPSGSGKSAALARFVRDYQQKHPHTVVIPHFIGASPRSTNLRDMLRRFCQVLKVRFGFAEEVPEEVAKLSVTFREFVGKVPAETRVLLVIDALNQLDEADRAQELYWMPVELPPHLKVIASCITESGKTEPVLEAFRWRKHCPVQLAALSHAEQQEIIRQVPSLSAKTLDEVQVRLLLSNPATANPLFLLVALEELRGFASYERLNERIAVFPRQGDTVTAIFAQVIERLDEEFNKKLVETVLTLVASARRGLSERELQELVAGLDGADDLFPVLRQLRPYLLSRAGLIDFYHRNLFKAVRERYLASEEQQRLAHARLAEYFHDQDNWLESLEEQRRRAKTLPPTPRPANVRKVDELPWQLLQAADWRKSEQLLTNLAFLEAKAEAGMVFDLAADFSAAIAAMSADRPLLRLLRLLEEALRRDIHFIDRHHRDYPQGLFQCLWNSCWWYDCPEAAPHYQEKRAPGQEVGIDLHRRLGSWRAEKQRKTPGFVWLRSLRPPAVHLGAPQQMVFRGHEGSVQSVAFSPDGRFLASGSDDRSVRVWDTHTGAQLHCLRGHEGSVQSVAFSPDGRSLASGSDDRSVRVWDTHTGAQLHCLRGHEGSVQSVAFSPNGRFLASGSDDRSVRVWDTHTGAQLHCLRGHKDSVGSVAFSPDRRLLASASEDGWVRFWEANSGVEVRCVDCQGRGSWSVAFCLDGRIFLASGGYKKVWVWDGHRGAELHCSRGHKGWVWSVAFSPDGRLLASRGDETVRVWDAHSGAELHCLRGHEGSVKSVAFSPDGWLLATGTWNKTVRIWDMSSSKRFLRLQGHTEIVTQVCFSAHGRRLVSWAGLSAARLWDTRSGIGAAVPFDIGFSVTFGNPLALLLGVYLVAVLLYVVLVGSEVPAWVLTLAGLVPCVTWLLLFHFEGALFGSKWRTLLVFEMPARPPPAPAWKLQSRGWETVIVANPAAEPIACFPEPIADVTCGTHPSGRIYAGAVSNYVSLFTLEGNPQVRSEEPTS